MTVPSVNHIFIGGYFNDSITIGNFELSNPEINNVYVAYLKDDTWLQTEESPSSKVISAYPNPFSDVFNIRYISDIEQIRVYNNQAKLISIYTDIKSDINIGEDWKPGLYMLQMIYANGEIENLTALKIK